MHIVYYFRHIKDIFCEKDLEKKSVFMSI
jgi:hypothetical protein